MRFLQAAVSVAVVIYLIVFGLALMAGLVTVIGLFVALMFTRG